MSTYPILTVHAPNGDILASNAPDIPAYEKLPEVDLGSAQALAENHGGYLMQQDDSYTAPFTLVDFTERSNV